MTKVGRLALRVEGEFWNAYYALEQDTMDGAILLGSIKMRFVEQSTVNKEAFVNLMRDVITSIIKDAIGESSSWGDPEPAPEKERSGSA